MTKFSIKPKIIIITSVLTININDPPVLRKRASVIFILLLIGVVSSWRCRVSCH